MTAEEFANRVNELILRARKAGLEKDEVEAELEGILAGMREEEPTP